MTDDSEAYTAGFDAGYKAGREAAGNEEEHTAGPLSLADVKRMTHDEINQRWDEILPLLEDGTHVK